MRRHRLSLLSIAFAAACFAQTSKPIEVAPGIALPENGIVFGIDRPGPDAVLQKIHGTKIHYNPHAGKNFLRGQVFAGPHSTVEVPGAHSEIVFTSTRAVFYVHLLGDDPDIMRNRLHLIWLDPGDNVRIAVDFSMNAFGGHRHRTVDDVPVDITPVAGSATWVKVTPKDPLVPGEFGFVSLPADPNLGPDIVYDFCVTGASSTAPYAPVKDTK